MKVPILAMKGGANLQTYVDILVPNNAKLTLIKVEYWCHSYIDSDSLLSEVLKECSILLQ